MLKIFFWKADGRRQQEWTSIAECGNIQKKEIGLGGEKNGGDPVGRKKPKRLNALADGSLVIPVRMASTSVERDIYI